MVNENETMKTPEEASLGEKELLKELEGRKRICRGGATGSWRPSPSPRRSSTCTRRRSA
jgi:hypothetical protein